MDKTTSTFALALAAILAVSGWILPLDGAVAQAPTSGESDKKPAPMTQQAPELQQRKEIVQQQAPMMLKKPPFTEANVNAFLEKAIDAPDRYKRYAEEARKDMYRFLTSHFEMTSGEKNVLKRLTSKELEPVYKAIAHGVERLELATREKDRLPADWSPLTLTLSGDCWGTREANPKAKFYAKIKPSVDDDGNVSVGGEAGIEVTCEDE